MKILVPTAGPKPAKENATYIVDMAAKLDAELAVLHVLDMGEYDDGRKALEIFEERAEKYGIDIETHIKEGKIVPVISEFAKDIGADLIVMGASQGQIVAEWIVSAILKNTQRPVVIIPWAYS